MTNRTRTRKLDSHTGSYQYWYRGAWLTTHLEAYRAVETISDQVLPGNGHNFDLVRTAFVGKVPVINGHPPGEPDHAVAIMTDYPVGHISAVPYYAVHSSVAGEPTDMMAATELAAMTNPSRPHVDVLAFVAELRELPHLLLKRSNDIGRDVSSGRLSNEFGWKPLIHDLKAILDFKTAFDHRVIELNALYRSGIRRKRKLFSGSSLPVTHFNGPLNRNRSCSIDGKVDGRTDVEVWGHCRWMPSGVPRTLIPRAPTISIHDKAVAAIAGIGQYGIDAATIWNLVPFSWLADWCSNTGDFLEASRNVVGAQISDIQIMRHHHTELNHTITYISPSYTVTPEKPVKHHDSYRRRPIVSLGIEAHFPFLNERKAAILADVVNGAFRPNKVSGKKGARTTFKGGKYNPLNPVWDPHGTYDD